MNYHYVYRITDNSNNRLEKTDPSTIGHYVVKIT